MFVVMALVTTVATTPLTTFLYPPWYQKKLEAWKRGEIDWDGNRLHFDSDEDGEKVQSTRIRKLLVYLRLDNLPGLFTFISLLGGDASTIKKIHPSKGGLATVREEAEPTTQRPLEVHGVRIIELTDRTSSVMKVSEADEHSYRDPVVNTFRTFAQLNNIAVSGSVSIVPEFSFAETLVGRASDMSSELLLIPWSETGSLTESDSTLLLGESLSQEHYSSTSHNSFIQQALSLAICNTAIFVNRGFGGLPAPARGLTRTVSGLGLRSQRNAIAKPISDRSHHIFFPFFGGDDDRVALRFVLQIAQNDNITATIIHIKLQASNGNTDRKAPDVASNITRRNSRNGSTTYLPATSAIDTEALALSQAQDTVFLHSLRDSLPTTLGSRVVFSEHSTSTPLATAIDHAGQECSQSPRNAGDLIVLGRGKNSRTVSEEEQQIVVNELGKTLSVVAQGIIGAGLRASVLVVQAGGRGIDGW